MSNLFSECLSYSLNITKLLYLSLYDIFKSLDKIKNKIECITNYLAYVLINFQKAKIK